MATNGNNHPSINFRPLTKGLGFRNVQNEAEEKISSAYRHEYPKKHPIKKETIINRETHTPDLKTNSRQTQNLLKMISSVIIDIIGIGFFVTFTLLLPIKIIAHMSLNTIMNKIQTEPSLAIYYVIIILATYSSYKLLLRHIASNKRSDKN